VQVFVDDDRAATDLSRGKLAGPDCVVDRVAAEPCLGADFCDRKRRSAGWSCLLMCILDHEEGYPFYVRADARRRRQSGNAPDE
jgi:hypothetical protein